MLRPNDLTQYLNPTISQQPKLELPILTTKDNGWSDVAKSMIGYSLESGLQPGNKYKGGSEYDATMNEMADQGELRGNMQSGWQQIRRGAVSRTASIIPKLLQGIGHVGGFVGDLGRMASGNVDYSNPNDYLKYTFDNELVNQMSEMDQGMNESVLGIDTRIYNTAKYTTGSLLDQLGTSQFWAKDAFDGVAFLASALIPGMVAGKAAKLLQSSRVLKLGEALSTELKGVEAGKRMEHISKILETGMINGRAITAKEAADLSGAINNLSKMTVGATAAYNTISEAGFEAYDTGKQLREELSIKKYGQSFEDLPDLWKEQIKEEVAPRQKETFLWNTAILAGPNYLQSKFFFGKPTQAQAIVRAAMKSGSDSVEQITKELSKNYIGSMGKNIGKNVITGMASEGLWEEGIQSAIQNYENRKGQALTDSNQVAGILEAYLDGLTDTDSQKAIFLGSLLGGMGGIAGGMRSYRDKKLEANQAIQREKSRLDVMNLIRQQYLANLSKPIKGLDENGQPIRDEEAYYRAVFNTMHDASKFTESMVANMKGDNLHAEFVNMETLSEMAYKRFSDPYFDSLDEAEQAVKTDLEFIAKGADTPDHIKPVLEEHKKAISNLRRIYEQIESSVPVMEEMMVGQNGSILTDPEKESFTELVKTNLFYESMKKNFFENIKGKDNSADDFDSIISDTIARIEELKDRKKRGQLLRQYKNYNDQLSQYRSTLAKEESTEEEKMQAQYEINKRLYLNGDNHSADSLFLQGSESVSDRLQRKAPEGKKIYFIKAMQSIAKQKIEDAAQDLKDGNISADDFLGMIHSNFPLITPEVHKTIEDSVVDIINQRNDLEQEMNNLFNTLDWSDPGSAQDELREGTERIQAKIARIDALTSGLEDIKKESQDVSRLFNSVDEAFKNNRIDQMEEGIYAANFTDNQGTVIPKQAAKLLSQLSKESEQSMSADLVQVEKTIEAFEQQRALILSGQKKDLLKDDTFQYFTTQYFKEIKKAYPSIELKDGDYLQNLDSIIEALNRLHSILKNNKDSRHQRQQEAYALDSEIKLSGIGLKKDGTQEHSQTFKFIENVIGKEKLDKILSAAKANGMEAPYVEVVLEEFKNVALDEQVLQIKSIMENRKLAFVDELIKLTGNSKTSVESFTHHPTQRLTDLLTTTADKLFSGKEFLDPKSPVFWLEKTKSVSEFMRALGLDNKIPQARMNNILSFMEIYKQLAGIEQVLDTLDSAVKYSDLVGSDVAHLSEDKKQPFLPTYQQLTAIRAIGKFLKSKVDTSNLSAFATLLGRAGTGKTTMVLSRVFRMLGVMAEDMLVSATNPYAVETIGKATGAKALAFEDLLKQDLKGKKLIILDEAAAVTDQQFEDIVKKVQDYNKNVAEKEIVRVVFAGDPNQLTYSGTVNPTISKTVDMNGVKYSSIRKIPPLTVAYRSDVSEINLFADEFMDNINPVTGIYATASDSIDDLNENTLGVHTDSKDKIIAKATQLFNSSKGKTSVAIIVDSEATKKEYEGKVPKEVEIITFEQSQGRSIDKVFVDITKSKIDKNMNDLNFNRVMYTAITRARSYVFVANNTGTFKQTVSKSTEENKQARAKDITTNADWYVDHIRKEEAIVDELINGKKTKKNNPVTNEKKPELETEEEMETSEEIEEAVQQETKEIPVEEEEEIEASSDDHILAYPENLSKSDLLKLKKNGKVKYVKAFFSDIDSVAVLILAETNTGSYARVGQLAINSKDADTDITKRIIHRLNATTPIVFGKKSESEQELEEDEIKSSTILEGKLKSASRLKYVYDGFDYGKGLIDRILDKWKKGFHLNGEGDIHVTLRIFTQKELSALNLDEFKFGHLKPGVPYMVIKGGGLNGLQYIEMEPAPINTSTYGVKELTTFRNAIGVLEDAGIGKLGDAGFNQAIRFFHYNYTTSGKDVVFQSHKVTIEDIRKFLPDITPDQFDLLEQQAENIVPMVYGAGKKIQTLTKSEAEERYVDDPSLGVQYKFIPAGKTNVKVYVQEKGETKFKPMEVEGLVEGIGPAQRLIKDIAKRHPDHVFSNGVEISRKRTNKMGGTDLIVSSLLSEQNSKENRGYEAIRKKFKEHLIQEQNLSPTEAEKRIKALSGEEIEQAYLNATANSQERENLENIFYNIKNNVVSQNINMDVLNEILTFDQDGESGMFEQNLMMDPFNNMGKNPDHYKETLNSLLTSEFSGVKAPKVVVSFETAEIPKPSTPEQKEIESVQDEEEQVSESDMESVDSFLQIAFNSDAISNFSEISPNERDEFEQFIKDRNICI